MRRLIYLLYFSLPMAVGAQPLTEAEALRLGLSRTEVIALEHGTRDAAQADVTAAGLWTNPTLAYSRERLRGTPDSVEESWQISQTFDLSGRRNLRREAAERRVDAAMATSTVRRADLAAEISRRFHEVLLGQQTVLAMETWAQRFARIETVVGKLAQAGDASGYDQRRLIRERQGVQARLTTERAMLARNRERLTALLGKSGSREDVVAGTLLPGPLSGLETALASLDRRPDLQLLARRAEAADLEGRAASRGWVSPGAFVPEGGPLFHIADRRVLWLELRVPESDAARLATPSGAAFRVDGVDQGFEIATGRNGRLVAVGGAVDAATRTVPVIFEFADPDPRLRIGMAVKAQVLAGAPREVIAVPASAVLDENGVSNVFVMTGGESFERKPIRLGVREGEWIEVVEGLEPGQRVVSRGAWLVKLASANPAQIGHGHAH